MTCCVTACLVSGIATAAPTGADAKGGGGGGGPGGGGGGGPGGGGAGGAGIGGADRAATWSGEPERDPTVKPWEVTAAFEHHQLIRQNDLGGAGENKLLNVFEGRFEYDPTAHDAIRLRAFLLDRFIADSGETGWRFDDAILSYTHYFDLPYQMTLKPGAWLTAPFAWTSQLHGYITDARVYVSLAKYFGKYFSVEPRLRGDWFVVRYNTAKGGSPNEKADFGLGLNAEFRMPFHPKLSAGIDLATSYAWYYDVADANPIPGNPTPFNGNSAPPVQQTYGGEFYLRYLLPTLYGFHADVSLAYAQGDPSLGYTSLLHDGVQHPSFGYRQVAEVYGVISARY